MTKTKTILAAAALTLAPGLAACGDDEGENQESTDPIVGVMELPISYRYQPSPPSNAVAVEVGPSNLRVDGRTVVELDNGKLPETAVAGNTITELKNAIESAPARRTATLRLFGSTPWRTSTLILSTLSEVNISEIAFMVRQGVGTDVGYLILDDWDVREQSDEFVDPPATHARQWSEMPDIWEEMYGACREGPYVDCSFKPSNIAEEGKMNIELFARGNAVKIELERWGAPVPEPAQPAEDAFLDGIDAPDVVEDLGEPATGAAFTWRFQATTPGADEENIVAKTMRPLCGAQPCGAVVEAEAQTPTMRVVSFIGATFPNGTDAPWLMFQIPPE
jgi:hypothetical protein